MWDDKLDLSPALTGSRPLSDIREATEPSVAEVALHLTDRPPLVPRKSSLKRAGSVKPLNSVKIVEPDPDPITTSRAKLNTLSALGESFGEGSSLYSITPSSVPPRKSSRESPSTSRHRWSSSSSGSLDYGRQPTRPLDISYTPCKPHRTPGQVKDIGLDSPFATFFRDPHSADAIDRPICRHSRVTPAFQTIAPLFVGGASVEGYLRVVIDGADPARHRPDLEITTISIDLIGLEELTSHNRRAVFLSLALDLLDRRHPPPQRMIKSSASEQAGGMSWTLRPSRSLLPFRLGLPLDVGPVSFASKHARIRYQLSATLTIRDRGRPYTVRCFQNINLLSTYDPERALRSLPSPLTASDEHSMVKALDPEMISITAGLHRQVWISGTCLFVDVHIINRSHKTLKKLELSVERDVLCYTHAAALVSESTAGQARIFQEKEQSILSSANLRHSESGWAGVPAHSTLIRTCNIDLPRGHATIKCGKFFEVRFFLNITLGTRHHKYVHVQLPIILIHMNSLDVVPNAVSQVASAIEEKRHRHQQAHCRHNSELEVISTRSSRHARKQPKTSSVEKRTKSPSLAGTAFAAPRKQSLERMRLHAAELQQIGDALDKSPRKYISRSQPEGNSSMLRNQDVNTAEDGGSKGKRSLREKRPMPHPARSTGALRPVGSSTSILSSSNISLDMQFHTPPHSNRKGCLLDDASSVGRRLRRLGSFESRQTRGYKEGDVEDNKARGQVTGNAAQPALIRVDPFTKQELGLQQLGPHSLGLSMHPVELGLPGPTRSRMRLDESEECGDGARPAGESVGLVRRASLRLKEQLDRSRFEFKAVRRKQSFTFRDWWGAPDKDVKRRNKGSMENTRQNEHAGWI